MGLKEDVLALAEELDGVSVKENCEACLASGTELCRGDLECAESAHKACAKRLRAIAEHDADDVTTVSAYDLLSDDDREAIAWVREMGGIERCEAFVHQGAMEHGYLLKIAHALGTSIYDGTDNADALLEKLEKRLMPEGMEWPRYESGETVQTGATFAEKTAIKNVVASIELSDDWFAVHGFDCAIDKYSKGERVKRPAVLAADGEPLEVGQTVWHVGNGVEFTVIGLPNPGEYQAVKLRLDDGAFTGLDPDQLTHQRPVLDEDGVPIKVGDTVWDIETGCGRTVRAVNDNETVEFDGYENRGWFGKFLTHAKPEPPDSRRAVVNEIGDEMAARIDLLVSSGRWSDAD